MAWVTPSAITLAAATAELGTPTPRQKSFPVPAGMTPSGTPLTAAALWALAAASRIGIPATDAAFCHNSL